MRELVRIDDVGTISLGLVDAFTNTPRAPTTCDRAIAKSRRRKCVRDLRGYTAAGTHDHAGARGWLLDIGLPVMDAGFFEHIVKPVDFERLERLFAELVPARTSS